jgi:hypothetical protein
MRAKAWLKNPDPRPRGLVFKISQYGVTPYWGGLVTTPIPGVETRYVMPGTKTFVGATREEALEKLLPHLQELRVERDLS